MKVKDDPTLIRIREARHRISEECGHDPQRIVEYYAKLEKNYQDRIISDSEEENMPGEPVKV
jgi:hypothetical protein